MSSIHGTLLLSSQPWGPADVPMDEAELRGWKNIWCAGES